MNLVTEIGDRREFLLAKAILIYEEQVFKQEQFATVHEIVREGTEPQPPRLGPGNLLTASFLKALCRGLEGEIKPVLLPANVLACTSDLLIWWTPPRLHRMFFSEGAEDRAGIQGQICPHPPLVWRVHRGCLYLRALRESKRPNAETPLMVAPYWNTEVTRGDVPPSMWLTTFLRAAPLKPFINQTLAYHALAMLARLFRHRELAYTGGFMDLRTGRLAPLSIESSRKAVPTSPTKRRSSFKLPKAS